MRLVVVGTGTEIGKTHLSLSLLNTLAKAGFSAAGLKPVESGVIPGERSDAGDLARASTFHVKQPPPYALAEPVSPHLAARRAGVTLDLARIASWVTSHDDAEHLVIETAGALLSPLAPGLSNLDLARNLAPDRLLLVAPDRLGVLHDVAACAVVLRTVAPELPFPLVVLQPPAAPDTSTGTNAAELASLGIATAVFSLPRARPTAPETEAAAAVILAALGIVSRETPTR